MTKKEKPKKKVPQKLTQKEKFIEYAKELECDKSGKTFKKAIKEVLQPEAPR